MTADPNRKWLVFALVATSIFMSTLDSSIVNIALPFIMQDFRTDVKTIQWVVLIYLVVVSSLLLSFGKLSDVKGRKPVYISGFSIFTAGSLLCAVSRAPEFLIFSRALQGCGASMLMACSPAIIVDTFPGRERGKALGMVGAVVAAGLATGPAAGGLLLEYFSWRHIFYINLPIGVAAAFSGWFILKKETPSPGQHQKMDIPGSLLIITAISSLIILLTRLPDWGAASSASLLLAALFIVSGSLFVLNEKNAASPLFDIRLLKIKLFTFPLISSALMFGSLFVIVFIMPFYLTYPCGYSAAKTGMIMIVPFLFLLFLSPAAGILYDRLGSRGLCMTGMGSLMLSLLSLIFIHPDMGVWSLLWRVSLSGIGTALFISPNNTEIMSSVLPEKRGTASGAAATSRNLGMVIGVALAGLVFSTTFSRLTNGMGMENYHSDMLSSFMTSFRYAMAAGLLLSLFGLVVTYARGKKD